MDKVINEIHRASMEIAEKTGVKYHSADAQDILRGHGIKVEDGVAYFTEDQLMDWVKKAPSAFTWYARNPDHDVQIGKGIVNPAPGYGAPLIMDADGVKRKAMMEDYISMCRIVQNNPDLSINGGVIVQPDDIPSERSALLMFYAVYLTSDKCLMTGSGDKKQMYDLMEMASIAFGGTEGLVKNPRILTIVNTNTPLQMDGRMTDTLQVFAEYGQPFAVTSGAMAGSTSPMTLAGTLAVANAEVLSAIAFAQMIREGTPLLYATQCETADMRNAAAAIGSPEGALCYRFSAEMSRYYGLPCRGGGCITDAKKLDVQAGYESMMTCLAAMESKVDLMIHGCGIMDGYACMSYEKMMVDFEIIRYAKRIAKGIPLGGEAIPMELIDEVGHGGQYLLEEHTLEYCREEPCIPRLSARGSMEPTALEDSIAQCLAEYSSPAPAAAVEPKIKSCLMDFMEQKGIERDILEKIDGWCGLGGSGRQGDDT